MDEALFCPNCGNAFPASDSFCVNCGSRLQADYDFCPLCGTRVNGEISGSPFYEMENELHVHHWLDYGDSNLYRDYNVKSRDAFSYCLRDSRPNDLRLIRKFKLEPDTVYYVTADIRTDGVVNHENSADPIGACISTSHFYCSRSLFGTCGWQTVDEELKALALETPGIVEEKMEKLRVADAISAVFNLFKRCNKYIDETAPWALAKDEANADRLATVLYNLVESICIGASLLKSFLPRTADKIFAQLNATERSQENLATYGLYVSGTKVTETPEILFARLDAKEVMEKVAVIQEKQRAEAAAEAAAEAKRLGLPVPGEEEAKEEESVIDIEAKPEITYDDFAKLQFQVGEIIACEEVKKSKKLLCSQVKIGSQVKQIVSGIKQHYSAEEMVGKKVMVLVNLKPATLAGIVSEGMLLCAEDENGELALMTPEKKMPAGAEIC